MKTFPTLFVLLIVLFSACSNLKPSVKREEMAGKWKLKKYSSPDKGLENYMNLNKDEVEYLFTDSLAYFTIADQQLNVNMWELDNRELRLTSQNSTGVMHWHIIKVNENRLVLRANNSSIGKRSYEFYR